ncbi:GNAT family protein [Colwellia asteriadis]|uniref:GNAT family protein n=1 Tax=Colwellia asteriadis TaxID=517723 RepID=A0ABN1LA06_9GAMM
MLTKTILESQLIKLEPMTLAHLNDFYFAGKSPKVWQHMPTNRCQDKATAQAWMQIAINEMSQGQQLAFITRDKVSNTVVGSTRLFRLNQQDKTIEIGHTFITPSYQRSYVNSHAKFLMLQYAFEVLGMVRVEICTHENNQQSRSAITRIGGTFEGILRKHRRSPCGYSRNTAIFSIIDDEWPKIKAHLLKSGKSEEEFCYVSS